MWSSRPPWIFSVPGWVSWLLPYLDGLSESCAVRKSRVSNADSLAGFLNGELVNRMSATTIPCHRLPSRFPRHAFGGSGGDPDKGGAAGDTGRVQIDNFRSVLLKLFEEHGLDLARSDGWVHRQPG